MDDPRFKVAKPKAGEPKTQREMYDLLHAAYGAIAKDLAIRTIPVGTAFITVDEDPTWAYKPDASFDAKTAVAPALPDQTHSLHMGWSWKSPAAPKSTEEKAAEEQTSSKEAKSSGATKSNAVEKAATTAPAKPTLGMDGHHANTAGQYLGACVWYEILFDTTCVGNTFKPKGLDEEFRLHLQKVAHETVAKAKAK
ncbi:MAG: hypothetical protein QM811_25480 [Pirellulales bacterium]